MSHHLQTVVELQHALDELLAAEKLLEGIPDWMQELHEEYSARKAEIDELEAVIAAAGQERRGAESSIDDLRERLRTFQDQISRVRNQREYGALLQEIDTAKAQIKECEELAYAAMERQEETRKRLEEMREAFQELDQRYATELAKWETEKPGVASQAEELRGRIEVYRERLPRNVLSLFERIRERHGGQALATIQMVERGSRSPQIWHCSVCNYRVRPQAVVAIRNQGALQHCDSCKRILYFAEEPD